MNSQKIQRILIMAGGTGGHVFPALVMAKFFQQQNIDVHWLGTKSGLEAEIIPEAGLPIHFIKITGLRGKGIKRLMSQPYNLLKAIFQASHIIRKIAPDVIVGMGGFVSGPGGIASILLRRPLIIHEQNARPGLTNKCLAFFAQRILQAFPNTFPTSTKLRTTGNPVRQEIEKLLPPTVRFKDFPAKLRVLVLGGSLGAKAINEVIPQVLTQFSPAERPEVLHQTGKQHFSDTLRQYQMLNLAPNTEGPLLWKGTTLVPFIKDMSAAYAGAHIVICRAGALTISELCTVGLGAILIPYPFAVDDHQTLNASFMIKNHAGLCIQQTELTVAALTNTLADFSQSLAKCLTMAEAAYSLRKVNVSQEIYTALCEVVE